jgi:cell division protein FtsL
MAPAAPAAVPRRARTEAPRNSESARGKTSARPKDAPTRAERNSRALANARATQRAGAAPATRTAPARRKSGAAAEPKRGRATAAATAPATKPRPSRARTAPATKPARTRGTAAPAPSPVARVLNSRGMPLVDRVLRGPFWVVMLGALLAGIVFLNVSVLELNRGIAQTDSKAAALERTNSSLRSRVAKLDSGERIQQLAAARGFVMPQPGDVTFLSPRDSDAKLAARRITAPTPDTTAVPTATTTTPTATITPAPTATTTTTQPATTSSTVTPATTQVP